MDGDFRMFKCSVYYFPIIINLYGFSIRIQDFAHMFSSKLGICKEELELSLWGDNYFNSKTKTIVAGAQEKAKKPLFVQIILENLWSVYESIVVRKDKIMTEKIVQNLQLKITPRDLKHSDPKVQIQAVLSKWLPLSDTMLREYYFFKVRCVVCNYLNFTINKIGMVCSKLPSPAQINDARAEKLMSSLSKPFDMLPVTTQQLKSAFTACSSCNDAPTIAFISKMTLVIMFF